MPKFIIQEGYQITGEFEIPHGISIIGRADDVALQISNHSGISREHCRVSYIGNEVTLEDLASSNGTFLNSLPIVAPVTLKHKDHIQLDDVLLFFDATDLAAQEQTMVGDKASGT